MTHIEPELPPTAHDITSFTTRSVVQLHSIDLAVGVLGLLFWVFLFTAGCLISSEPFRKAIGGTEPLAWTSMLRYCLIILATYTVTNVAMLCCISSMLGGLYRGATKAEYAPPGITVVGIRFLPYLIQGFVIFLLLISGLFLLGEEPFSNLTQNKYIRMAGTASLFSFLAGYKPRIFYRWLQRFDESTNRKSPGK
jgi:hypothetical protein